MRTRSQALSHFMAAYQTCFLDPALASLQPVPCRWQCLSSPPCHPSCLNMCSAAGVDGTVPLRRAVVEDMLLQRLTDRQAEPAPLLRGNKHNHLPQAL